MNFENRKLGILAAAIGVAAPAAPVQALDLGAFMDVGYVSSDAAGDEDNFAIGGLDLYATEKISENTTAFFEVVYENDGSVFILDVERYWIRREISDAFRIAAGRFHAPLGFWNRNYHHGVLIQDTVSRPAFLDFEDGDSATLPMHVIGLMATGRPARGVNYELAIGNGTSYDTSAAQGEILLGNVDDLGSDKALFGRVTFAAPGLPLNVGLFLMSSTMVEAAAAGSAGVARGAELAQTMVYGLDLRYSHSRFDALVEYYSLDNDPGNGLLPAVSDGQSHDATAYYAQLGYQVTDQFKVVYRYEDLSFDATDAYFNVLGTREYSANVVALRYELDDSNAITLEYNDVDSPGSANDVATTTLNWSFLMF